MSLLRSAALALAASAGAVTLVTSAGGATRASNDRIVFVSAGDFLDGRLEINSVNPDGSGLTRLTRHSPSGFAPRWTSDGRSILFLTYDDQTELYSQWRMNVATRRFRQLSRGSPSPSGRWVARPGERGIEIVTTSGRTVRTLAFPLARRDYLLDSVWSHDERLLATTVVTHNGYGDTLYARILVAPVDGSRPPQALEPRRIGNVESALSWAPDDRMLAVDASGSDGYTTIVLVSPDGRQRRPLVADANYSGAHTWSPDGSAIAYVRQDGAILTVRIRDGRKWVVARPDARREDSEAVELAWSRRGNRIAFSDDTGVHTLRANGKGGRRLSSRGAFSRVDWSPDGSRLVFSDGYEVLVVRADGRGLRRLTRAVQDESPVWSADRSRIAFVRGQRGFEDPSRISVFVMRRDGSGVRRIGRGYGPLWAPKGHRLLYVDVLPDEPERMATLRAGRIVVADDDAGTSRQVAVGTAPTWSPDGTQLAYMRYKFEAHDTWLGQYAKVVGATLWVVGSDGSGQRQLLDSSDPRWAAVLQDSQEYDDSTRIPLPRTPSWSPKGRWIAVTAGEATVLVDATTGELRRVGGRLGDWSPDGDRLLVLVDRYPDRLVAVDVVGGTEHVVDRARNGFSHESPVWSPDGSQVAFIGCRGDSELLDCDVYVVGADGRGRKRIIRTPGVERSLAWARRP